MPRSLHHDLYITLPRALRQFAQAHQFLNLTHIGRVRKTSRSAGIAKRYRHVVLAADLQYLIVIFIKRILLTCHAHPCENKRTASGDNIHLALVLLNLLDGLSRDSAVERHEINTVLGMQAHHVDKILCGERR